ncbi:unnamed protein product [Echinostoma caproni]|uniref:TMEM131_like domain-containing protein n=1 Tax=Echinostoma caproni TaxID=27848 RepID=A0A183A8K1_9TREM|nr:unnamed protein product [Echinostoma caproni]
MIVHDLFPGKTVRRNVIIQSSYPGPVKLLRLQLESDSTDPLRHSSTGFVRLYRQQAANQPPVTESDSSHMILEPQQPTIVATVLFDPAGVCVDVLSGPGLITSMGTREPICHTGFSLDSTQGLQWLTSITANDTTHVDATDRFHAGLLQSAITYAQLRSAWMSQTTGTSSIHTKHLLETYLSLSIDEQHNEHHLNHPSMGNETSVHWADLSASLIWPRLVSSRKHPVKRSVAQCQIRTSTSAGGTEIKSNPDEATLEQALRAYFPPTIPGESVQCDLIIINPSDRPVFVQPILLDSVYAMRCDTLSCINQTNPGAHTEPLVSFLHALGVPASTEHVTKLTHLLTGTFQVEIIHSNPIIDFSYQQLPSPTCCPIFWLPASVGQLILRLTFIPDLSASQSHSRPDAPPTQLTSHNLLFLRNNLTALEPVWLNARLGRAAISLGMVSTDENQTEDHPEPSDTTATTSTLTHENKSKSAILGTSGSNSGTTAGTKPTHTGAIGSINLFMSGEWHVALSSSSHISIVDTNSSDPRPLGSWATSLIPPTSLASVVRLEFDFSERAFWPFCTDNTDLQLAYSFPNHVHSDLLETKKHTSGSERRVVHTITHPGEFLASLSLRRRLVLVNSGDVPIELRAIILVSGSKTSDTKIDDASWSPWSHKGSGFTCSYRGFQVHPCLMYSAQAPHEASPNGTDGTQFSNHSVLLAPGEQFLLEIRYRPDFVYSGTAARLWLLAHPHHSGPWNPRIDQLLTECMVHSSNSAHCAELIESYRFADVQLNAVFPPGFLRLCLNALPRPWIEYILWVVVVCLFTINLLGVMLMGCLDASRLYAAHERVRVRLNRIPFNAHPDPARVLRFDSLVADPFASAADSSGPQGTGDKSGLKEKGSVTQTDHSSQSKKDDVASGTTIIDPANPSQSPVDLTTNTVHTTPKTKQPTCPTSAQNEIQIAAGPVVAGSGKGNPEKSVNGTGTDSGAKCPVVYSVSDDEPWIMSRSSFKLLSKSPVVSTTTSLLKPALDDRKPSKSVRKADFPKITLPDTVGTTPDRPTGRVKKKSVQLARDSDDRDSPSPSERTRTTVVSLSVEDDQDPVCATKLSPMRRSTRKLANSTNPNSGSRSKVSDAPKTEAGIAAAVRATMRLAEEAGLQARRKVSNQTTDQFRNTRDKRDLPSGHSSTSSSSGPDQDPVHTKNKSSRSSTTASSNISRDKPSPLQHGGHSANQQAQQQQQQLQQQQPCHQQPQGHTRVHRASPTVHASKRSVRHFTGQSHGPILEHQLTYGYNRSDHENNYNTSRQYPLFRSRAHSDYQPGAPYPVCGTALDLDLPGEVPPELFGPHLGLCWPASPMEFERAQSYPDQLMVCGGLWPGAGPPPPPGPPGPHWDDAVVEVSTTSDIWDPIPLGSNHSHLLNAQDAMEQIAADSRAFAESLLHLSPKRTRRTPSNTDQVSQTNRQAQSASNRPDRGRSRPTELPSTGRDFVAAQSPSDSDRTPCWDSAFPPVETFLRTTSLLGPSPVGSLDREPLFDRSISSPIPTDSGQLPGSGDNACSIMESDRTPQLLVPLMREILLSPTPEHSSANQLSRWDAILATNQSLTSPTVTTKPTESITAPGSSFSHYFYELPQITMARRQCMLAHEGRQDETRYLDPVTPPTDIDTTGAKTTALTASSDHSPTAAVWTDTSLMDNRKDDTSSRSVQPRVVKRTRSESSRVKLVIYVIAILFTNEVMIPDRMRINHITNL